MKRIIDRKVYNTETAKEIANWSNGLGGGDFNAMEETLYRTKKGVFFLEYWGGTNTCYAESNGNMSSEGRGIKPVDDREALNWLEKHGKTEFIEEYFPDEIEEA